MEEALDLSFDRLLMMMMLMMIIAKVLRPGSLKRLRYYSWQSWITAVVWCTSLETSDDLNLSENNLRLKSAF